MPNRFIKESICTSDNLNNLSPEEEVFFYRLIVNCDDFGLMDARPSILRAKLFPLRTEKIKLEAIESWLDALIANGLIFLYESEDRIYLKMSKWENHQQTRANKSKYPNPDIDNVNLLADDIKCYQLFHESAKSDRTRISLTLTNTNKKKRGLRGKGKEYTPLFEQAYKIFPRPQAKVDTFANWNNLLDTYTEEQLLQFVQNYIDYYNSIPEGEKSYSYSSNNFFGKKAYYTDFKEPKKWEGKQNKQPSKPPNAHNFEQRQYSDTDFEKLYKDV